MNFPMQKVYFVLFIACLCLAACKKSDSGTPNKGNLLARYVKIKNQDSVAYDFSYDNNGLVTLMKFTGTGFGPLPNIQTTQMVRNGTGVITRLINGYPSPDPQLNPNDTANITFDNSNSRYTLMLTYYKRDASGQPIDKRDSTLFVYDNSGKITQRNSYYFNASSAGRYALGSSHFYNFDQQGNLVRDSVVSYIPGYNGIPQWVINYTYDGKTNPLKLGNEAFLLLDRDWIGLPRISGWSSSNNVVSGSYRLAQNATSNFSVQRSFTYNLAGLPAGSTDQWWTATGVTTTTAGSTRYYYQ